ncbi:MAG TPA: FAD-dependent oxidoreductase [Acidimicrobiales bacterium]|nr:FAD-dependent oxidoreductase [Acidimicrobiales bacterium]HUX03691.1 FAD-dependent oxidoreductase [Acidimicrobiales bacterium]
MAGDVLVTALSGADHVVVVGAGLAGWRFAQSLRRDGYDGALTLIGAEPYAPYDRPPLSKQVLAGKWDVDKTTLATPELVSSLDVVLRLGVAATALDVATTTVHLADGVQVAGTHVVIATGSRARHVAYSAGDLALTLRTRDDLIRLRHDLSFIEPGGVIAIIGGGFIGAEAATALHSLGYTPIVLEAAARPLVGILGDDVSRWLGNLATDAGIELRNDQRIGDVEYRDDRFVVRFDDGSALEAAAVIVAAGASVNDEWLATSGLTIDNGVVVDADLLATDRVGAIGDVARFMWSNTLGEELVRIEHWQIANDHATALARLWATGRRSEDPLVPYFWSDQYGKKIQMLGHARPDDDVRIVKGAVEEGKWLAVFSRGGVVSGVVTLSQPRALMLSKGLLDVRTTLDQALELAPWSA